MGTLHHDIEINAPIEAVWKAVADLVAVQEYNPLVASARYLTDKHEGVGAARRCELKPKGWVEERIWDWNPPHVIGLEVAASEWPIVFMKWRTELRKDGPATRITQAMDYKVKFGPLGALMDVLIMRRMLDKGINGAFEGLKRHVENAAGAGQRKVQ
jgi:carbon monoxide dehydrogenase subunit G